jgi:hypothetical protein
MNGIDSLIGKTVLFTDPDPVDPEKATVRGEVISSIKVVFSRQLRIRLRLNQNSPTDGRPLEVNVYVSPDLRELALMDPE